MTTPIVLAPDPLPDEAGDVYGRQVLDRAAALAAQAGWGDWPTLDQRVQFHFRQVALAEVFAQEAVLSPAEALERIRTALPVGADDAIDELRLMVRTRLPFQLLHFLLEGLRREGVVGQTTGMVRKFFRVA